MTSSSARTFCQSSIETDGLLHLLGGELRHLDAAGLAFAGILELVDLALVDRDQLLPVAALLVHLLDERERLAVVRIQLQDRLVGLDRLRLVGELLEEQIGDPRVQRDLVFGRLDDRGLLAQQRDQVRPALHRLVLRGELVGRVEVVGLDVEDLVVRVDDHHIELQTIAIDLDHLLEDRDLVVGRRPARLLDGLFQRLDERVPAFRLLVQIRERLARRPRLRRLGDDLFPGVDPLVDRLLGGFVGRLRFARQLGGKIIGNAVAVRAEASSVFFFLPWPWPWPCLDS